MCHMNNLFTYIYTKQKQEQKHNKNINFLMTANITWVPSNHSTFTATLKIIIWETNQYLQ